MNKRKVILYVTSYQFLSGLETDLIKQDFRISLLPLLNKNSGNLVLLPELASSNLPKEHKNP